jgi:pilus assembly protein CpaF
MEASRPLSPSLHFLYEEVKRDLFENHSQPSSKLYREKIGRAAERTGYELHRREVEDILILLEKDAQPFGLLQDLVDNESVSDIVVTEYSKISVQHGRSALLTAKTFSSPLAYEQFVENLLIRAGTSYSQRQPIADGMIGSLARIHAVHKSLCTSGPYLTVRINRFSQVGLPELVTHELAPSVILEYLKGIILSGSTLLIAGEVGTGKTTLARALASTIPHNESILVIEDTPEIRLSHPHVRYLHTRGENTEGVGSISPSDCIRAGMRMAMNRIVFGEIRDSVAAEAFIDVCASGHPGLTTVHGKNASDAVTRLELFLGRAQPGVLRSTIREQICTAIQVIAFVKWCPFTKRRRIFEVREIGPVADEVIRCRNIFHYDPLFGGSERVPVRARWKISSRATAYREILEPEVSLSRLPNELFMENT